MDRLTDNQKKIIDRYYDENNNDTSKLLDDPVFEEMLEDSLHMMDIDNSNEDEININFMNIIAAAEEIRVKKTTFKEYIAFITVSGLIMSLFAIGVLTLGQKFLFYFEISIVIAMPIIIIAFGLYAVNKERVRQ
jgi:hypothetical protein